MLISLAIEDQDIGTDVNFALNTVLPTEAFITNGWWRSSGKMKERWLHSDIKDAAFFHIYPIYKKVVTDGDLE